MRKPIPETQNSKLNLISNYNEFTAFLTEGDLFKSMARKAAIGGGCFFFVVVAFSRALSCAIAELTLTSPSGNDTFLSLMADILKLVMAGKFKQSTE